MPLSIDRTSEEAISSLFGTTFIDELHKYLGIDPETATEDMPINVEDLLHEAISTCESDQWRFILPKDVTLQLPTSALCYKDQLLFLPLGPAPSITISYVDTNGDTQSFTDFSKYLGEPIRLFSETWSDLLNDVDSDQPYPITVEYTPGYTSFAQIPKSTIRALKILTYHYFTFRDTVVQNMSSVVAIPEGYEHNRNLGWLNNHRANKYIVDDWTQVSPT